MYDKFGSSAVWVQPGKQHFAQSHSLLYRVDEVLLKVLQIRDIAFVCTFFFLSYKFVVSFFPQISSTFFFTLQHQWNTRVEIYPWRHAQGLQKATRGFQLKSKSHREVSWQPTKGKKNKTLCLIHHHTTSAKPSVFVYQPWLFILKGKLNVSYLWHYISRLENLLVIALTNSGTLCAPMFHHFFSTHIKWGGMDRVLP